MYPRPKSTEKNSLPPQHPIVILGTDTEVGKTLITGLLAKLFHDNGYSVITQKWIQAGGQDPVSDDIQTHLSIIQNSTSIDPNIPLNLCVPITLKTPASPHLAAKMEDISIETPPLIKASQTLKNTYDIVLLEGSGGLMVPINETETFYSVLKTHRYPCILVIDNKLGAINHSLLTIHALKNANIPILGTLFTQSQESNPIHSEENPKIIEKLSQIPTLGQIPHQKDPKTIQLPQSIIQSIENRLKTAP